MKEYRFKTPDGKLLQVTLNEEQTAIVTQAESDYTRNDTVRYYGHDKGVETYELQRDNKQMANKLL